MARQNATGSANGNTRMSGEKTEPYVIAPRNAGDAAQLQELQRCKEAIEQQAPGSVSIGRNLLKARLSQSLAQDIQETFGASLIVERDAPLSDPRLMPDFKI